MAQPLSVFGACPRKSWTTRFWPPRVGLFQWQEPSWWLHWSRFYALLPLVPLIGTANLIFIYMSCSLSVVKVAEISPPVAVVGLGVSGHLGSFGGFPQRPHSSTEERVMSTHI